MKKQEIIDKLSAKLDELPDLENLTLGYLSISLADYNPDNTKFDRKYSYREYEISLDFNSNELLITDTSQPFKCCMGYKDCEDCEERGCC